MAGKAHEKIPPLYVQTLRLENATKKDIFIAEMRAVNGLGLLGHTVQSIQVLPQIADHYISIEITYRRATRNELRNLQKEFRNNKAGFNGAGVSEAGATGSGRGPGEDAGDGHLYNKEHGESDAEESGEDEAGA